MANDSTFGAPPERLRRLLLFGRDESDENEQPIASWDILNEKPGSEIGRYRLVEVIGEGGMGVVYLAEQEEPIRRRVALKVIKPGMDSKSVIARFEAERQALALLDHPNIARVHDAGTAESGRPYFVMEYVKGLSITEHCDCHKLTIEDRLDLFRQVCLAVHHAHQKGIIHRDIKPSNILVSTQDDQAVPKIIDFGVAKAVSQPLTERTLYTEQGQLFGTLEYMSPEQADMVNEDIDTRSDIYSLGVLLYVLLTGVLPFDSKTLRGSGIEQVRMTIRDTDPKTPSTRLTRLGEEAKKVAEKRRTEVAALAKCLHRELEWIPLKAMRKERSERYRSASELADDIDNYLQGTPLLAGPLTAGYQLRKFLRRHKALVGAIAAVLVVSTIGIVVSVTFALGQAKARAEAQLIADFLQDDVLGSVSGVREGEATVSYVLDEASKILGHRFKDKPLVEAKIREKLGWTYRHIGKPNQAEQHFEHAIRIFQQHHGEEHEDTVRVTGSIGWVYQDQGRYHDMESLWTKNLKIRQRVSSVESQMHIMNGLAVAYSSLGKYKEAESLYEKMLELVRRELREENVPLLPHWKSNLAGVYKDQGRYAKAERLFVEMLKTAEWPEGHKRGELSITIALADTYREQGRYDKAEPLLVKTLEKLRLLLGKEHLHNLRPIYSLARLYMDQNRYDEAETLFSEALQIARQRLRLEHPVTLRLVNGLAVLRTKQEQYDEAETLFDEALKGRQRELGEDHPDTLESKNDLGVLHTRQGDFEKAESLLSQALDGRQRKLGTDHPATLQTMHELAVLYKGLERYVDAERRLLEAVKGRRLKLSDTHPHTLESWHNLIELYEAWGKPEEAEKWRAKLPQKETVEQ